MVEVTGRRLTDMKGSRGFTLIELIVVIVILAVLAIVAIPKYLDLTQQAKASGTKASLGSVRSTLYMIYASTSASATPAFPAALAAADFASGTLPLNQCNDQSGIGVVATAPAGTATSATNGFWYIVATGQAGAYSDGSADVCGNTAAW